MQPDCVLLIVSASIRDNGQTFKHIELTRMLGIQQMIVAVNKMDTTDPPFSEKRFDQMKNEIFNHMKEIDYQPMAIVFIPISGLHGDNLVESSDNMTWFRSYATGRTVWETLDAIVSLDRHTNRPLRIPLNCIYRIGGIGTVAIGQVASGILTEKKILNFAPSNLLSDSYTLERVSAFSCKISLLFI